MQWAERVRAYVRMHGAGYTLHRAGEMLAARVLLRDEWRFRREEASKRELAVQRAHPFPDVCISVVVPVFNTRPKFLRALADSLLAQTHGAWEVCLYDGGSTSARNAKGAGSNRRAGQPIPCRVRGGKRGHIRQHEPRD